MAKHAARRKELDADARHEELELDDLIGRGYLPARAFPRVQPQPEAPAKAGE